MNVKQLSQTLGQQLKSKKWRITTAESCTGGAISAAITDIAGSSDYFDCAFVTYSNNAKSHLVNVSSETLTTYGAVSEQTVVEMAKGAQVAANAHVAIAVSGIAGPGGGTESKPVGTVWIAIAIKDSIEHKQSTVWSQCFLFAGDRETVRAEATTTALLKACTLTK